MPASIRRVVTEALTLPAASRAFLAEKLLESLELGEDFKVSPEWKAEIASRCREVDQENIQLLDGEEVFDELRKRLG